MLFLRSRVPQNCPSSVPGFPKGWGGKRSNPFKEMITLDIRQEEQEAGPIPVFEVEQEELVQVRPHPHKAQQGRKRGLVQAWVPSPLFCGHLRCTDITNKVCLRCYLPPYACTHNYPFTSLLQSCSQGSLALTAWKEEIGTATDEPGVQVSFIFILSAWQNQVAAAMQDSWPGMTATVWLPRAFRPQLRGHEGTAALGQSESWAQVEQPSPFPNPAKPALEKKVLFPVYMGPEDGLFPGVFLSG